MTRTLAPGLMVAGLLLTGGCDEPLEPAARVSIVMQTPLPNELTSDDVVRPPEAIEVSIGEIHLHRTDDTWIEVVPEDEGAVVRFGGAPQQIAIASLPAGDYDQIQIWAHDAEVVLDGKAEPLEIVSSPNLGFDVQGDICLLVPEPEATPDLERIGFEGDDDELPITDELVLRWDAGRGVSHGQWSGYWLLPSVWLEHGAECW